MKPKIRTPYFEIGTKNYIYGDTVLAYAKAADEAAKKYDIDVLFITPATEIRRVVENTSRLIVLAPYMRMEVAVCACASATDAAEELVAFTRLLSELAWFRYWYSVNCRV